MFFFHLLNNLSITQKIWGLVLLPTLVILTLSGRQVFLVNKQLESLDKTTHIVHVMETLKHLNTAAYQFPVSGNTKNLNQLLTQINTRVGLSFSVNETNKFTQLTREYQETLEAITNAEDIVSKNDSIQWQTDVYKQMLLTLEKTYLKHPIPMINSHLIALFQFEWLASWAKEENRQSELLITPEAKSIGITNIIRNEISALIQNQQLFIERFIAMNADEEQVNLMLSAFSNNAFHQSNLYRTQLLSETLTAQLTPDDITQGQLAFAHRFNLFQNVANVIGQQLQKEIKLSVNVFEKQRLKFLTITAVSIIIVLLLGVTLARRITNNLQTVLNFLENKHNQNKSLTAQISGRDELNKFAENIERLTIERKKSQQELLTSKNEAVKAKEEAISASKAKSSFLANMSHEIRTPLNGVIGISEILTRTSLNAAQQDYVDTIEKSSLLLLNLINDILDFSKIESGKLALSPYSTSLRELIYDIAAIIAPKLKEKGVALYINIDETLPLKVMADDHRLKQILMNLLSNAAKFTSQGSVSINVKQQQKSKTESDFIFEIIDTGIGINASQQRKIFEPFSQEDNSTTREFGGTGLGLAISTQLLELMNSNLELESEVGKGSRFHFTLPLTITHQQRSGPLLFPNSNIVLVCNSTKITNELLSECRYFKIKISTLKKSLSELNNKPVQGPRIVIYVLDETLVTQFNISDLQTLNQYQSALCLVQPFNIKPIDYGKNISALITYPLFGNQLLKAIKRCDDKAQSENKDTINTTKPVNKQKVLLVDDNKINQKVAALHISTLGYQYDIANNGQEAIKMATSGNYDFILMDCMMPIKDGFIATKEIREYEINKQQQPSTIIALTASINEDIIQKCYEAGMNNYLAKPFKADELKQTLSKLSSDNSNPSIQHNIQYNKKEPTDKNKVLTEHQVTTETQPLRVLLVEDNKINQKVASLLLDKAGYQNVTAMNGQEAIDIYRKDQNFDIILMDLMMPVKDGFKATTEIRTFEKETNLPETPIIAVTASVINDDIKQCFYAGMNAYIPKPIQPQTLYDEIENQLEIAKIIFNN